MPEIRQPRHIASTYCAQYKTIAEFSIQDQHPSGLRQLIVQYKNGGYDGQPTFAAAIPPDWTEQDIARLLRWSMKNPSNIFPAWEIPSRIYGSPTLFRWWAGEEVD